jgi:hypothetical protein
MTDLSCSAKSCCHNSDYCCCLPSINVKGNSASKSDDTCCGSYFEDKSGSVQNVASNDAPNITLDICCEAADCVYNETKKCNADHIDISGISATNAGETLCSTFRSR